jgi:hypothetical protein
MASTASRAVRFFGSIHSSVRSVKSGGEANSIKQALTTEHFPRFLTFVSVAGVVTGYALMENIHKTAVRHCLLFYPAEPTPVVSLYERHSTSIQQESKSVRLLLFSSLNYILDFICHTDRPTEQQEREHLEKYMMDNKLSHSAAVLVNHHPSLHVQRRFTIAATTTAAKHRHYTPPTRSVDTTQHDSNLWTHAE